MLAEGSEADHIIRLGYITDSELRALYENALCLIFPSLYEGFGLPPLEAMSCGCPVLSSNKASLPEIYRDAVIYFDPTSIEEMHRVIKEFMENFDLQNYYRRKGLLLVTQYTWRNAAKSLLEVIVKNDVKSSKKV